ncbi:MAG: serine/threonine protein kinase, partial [Kitasatospora sp.]|nr:serine/threonine protein kinase [Kitasatospora sp.]
MTRPAAPGTSPLQPTDPDTHAGHRLLARLGTGGSGTVYLARNPEGRVVALKVFRAAARPAEAAALRSLAGKEHFPGFVDAGEDWHATAYVIGPSLAATVTAHGPWPEPALRALAAELAAALTELHTAGLVHRDLTPANVLLTAARPVVVDLGLAAPPGTTAAPGGTPAYLSPEQAAGHPVGPPADVHALGAVLVHAATGRPPYGEGDAGEILYRLAHQRPDLDAVPDTLRPLLAACLEQDPAARPTPARIRERAAAQGPFGDRLPRPVLAAVAARLAAAGTTGVHRPDPATARGPARRRVLAASGGALLAAAAGGTAWALTAGRDPKSPAPPVSGPSPSRGPDGAPPPDWTFRGNIDPAGDRTPMPFDDVVVVPADLEGTLLGVDTRRGTLRWSTATGAGSTGP